MTNEEYLVATIKRCLAGMEMNVKAIKEIPDPVTIPGFDDGKRCGFHNAICAIEASLRMYERKVKNELPHDYDPTSNWRRLEPDEPKANDLVLTRQTIVAEAVWNGTQFLFNGAQGIHSMEVEWKPMP